MSVRLTLLNALLRAFVKPVLRRMPSPEKARRHLERSTARLRPFLPKMRYSEDRFDGPGGTIPVEWVARRDGAQRRRILIYLHGGAYIMGSPRTHRSITSGFARRLDLRVLVPEYRLAPEHPAPAAVDDALAVYTGLLRQGYEPGSICLAGESAGGGLCLALILALREKGYPLPAAMTLFSPWTDLTMSSASVTANASADPMLPAERFAEVAGYYVGSGNARDPLISPLLGSWGQAPPTLILVGSTEILLDDAVRMAAAMGERATLEMTEDAPHAWPFFAPLVPEANAALDRAAAFIDEALA